MPVYLLLLQITLRLNVRLLHRRLMKLHGQNNKPKTKDFGLHNKLKMNANGLLNKRLLPLLLVKLLPPKLPPIKPLRKLRRVKKPPELLLNKLPLNVLHKRLRLHKLRQIRLLLMLRRSNKPPLKLKHKLMQMLKLPQQLQNLRLKIKSTKILPQQKTWVLLHCQRPRPLQPLQVQQPLLRQP